MKTSLYDYCAEHDMAALLAQWHPSKNTPLTPQTVSRGSKRRVWWKCEKGHEWQAVVHTRVDGNGCPYCGGKKAYPGENDLAPLRPDLAAQWHPSKNRDRTPTDVMEGSHYKAWWRCEKGHEWQAIVKSRAIGGTGCPVCANRQLKPGENDLAATHPDLAAQWHPSRNGALTPHDVVAGTWRKVWWICGRGHEWQAMVLSRACGGAGCPVCAGRVVVPGENDLATHFPGLAAQWHPTHNGTLTPEGITPTAMVGARTANGSDCPYCSGHRVLAGFNDLATLKPAVAKQWHPTLNGTLTPEMVTARSHKKVWWECPAGHIWRAVIYSRVGPQECGCPVCSGHISMAKRRYYDSILEEAARSSDSPPHSTGPPGENSG